MHNTNKNKHLATLEQTTNEYWYKINPTKWCDKQVLHQNRIFRTRIQYTVIASCSVHPAAGLKWNPYSCWRMSSGPLCRLQNTSRSEVSRPLPHWPRWCHLGREPGPGCEQSARKGRLFESWTGTSRWSAGSASSRDRRQAHGNAATKEWKRPAVQ